MRRVYRVSVAVGAIALGVTALGVTANGLAATPTRKPVTFTPPPYAAMPGGKFGAAVKLGENIFRHTTVYAKGTIGNGSIRICGV